MSTIKYGCDPETFAAYDLNGIPHVISPAILNRDCGAEIIGGNNKHPEFIRTEDFIWMMDGAAFELTLRHPYESPIKMWKMISTAKDELKSFLEKFVHPEFGQIFLFDRPTINIDVNPYLSRMEDEQVWQGFIFGCDPDFDAIQGIKYTCITKDVWNYPFRHGGGHIHLSGEDSLHDYIEYFIQLMAISVGNYCIANSVFPSEEKYRVTSYGSPGRYRPQLYKGTTKGIEYRSPSNSWTNLPEEKVGELFSWSEKAIGWLLSERADIIEKYLPETVKAITSCDQELCREILDSVE